MNRRCALGAIAAGLVLSMAQVRAQPPVHRIGFLASTQIPEKIQAWEKELRDRGYVVGGNLRIEYRFFQGRYEQIPALIAELVAFGPEIIVTSTSNSAVAVHTAAPAVPMVFFTVADPVGLGLAKSLAHPGGNATGLATLAPEAFIAKQLQILKEVVPSREADCRIGQSRRSNAQIAVAKAP